MNRRPPQQRIPLAVARALVTLQGRGHVVEIRSNRNGSLRFSVDGRRETDALTMIRRYRLE